MARPLRIEYAGAIYHVTARGNAGMAVFGDDADRRRFLDLFEQVVTRFKWVCYAYCLVENHYHLVVETTAANLSAGMRQINGVYTQYFNRSHARVGHLFQGRFKAILVERETYLVELCRHVVLNPVRIHLVAQPEDYPWSSYRATGGMDEAPALVNTAWLLSQFSPNRAEAQQRYREFVMAGLGQRPIWKDLKHQCVLGSPEFLAEIGPVVKGKNSIREIRRLQRKLARPSLAELFARERDSGKEVRNALLKKASLEYGYTFSEIGRHIGLHYATVSRIVRGK